MLVVNTDVHARIWPHLTVDGHTLELAPGETADVDIPDPDEFDDAYLKAVEPQSKRSQKADKSAADPAAPGDPDAAPAADTKE